MNRQAAINAEQDDDRWLRVTALIAGWLLILLGLGVVVYQTTLWLQHGVWTP